MKLLEVVANELCHTFRTGGTLYTAGCGGSHAQAEHLAAEMMGRFMDDRDPLPAFCLGSNAATLSCIANDYGWEEVYARQARVMMDSDTLVLFSTSGESPAIVEAAKVALDIGVCVVAICAPLSRLSRICSYHVPVEGTTAERQERTQVILHRLCELVEERMND